MFRVLLITKNQLLSEFCRKNLPQGFSLKTVAKYNLQSENLHGIVIFDSSYLAAASDSAIAAAAQKYAKVDGAVSLSILMNEDDKSRTFSLFPENLLQVQSLLSYRLQNGKIQGIVAHEWRWFLETQYRHLKQLDDRALTLGENEVLAERLAQVASSHAGQIKFPPFMHGKSQAIIRFREQLFAACSRHPYLFVTGKGDIPAEEFLDYYCKVLRPETGTAYEMIDLVKTPKHLQGQALWPAKKKLRRTDDGRMTVIGVQNLHFLDWQNQATLFQHLKNLPERGEIKNARYVFFAPHEIHQQVKRGSFRQELLSLLRKASAEFPPLYERPEDLSQIAAEYINKKDFSPLAEQQSEVARKIMNRFDLSSGYKGLFLTLDLMNDLEKSRGVPVFELMRSSAHPEAFDAARAFLREQVEPDPASLFQGLAGGEKEALSLDFVERNYIAAVCERYGWQVTDAARHLGISRKTLYDKMRRYKLSRPENRRKAS